MLLVENCAIQQLHSGAVIVAIQKFNSVMESDVYCDLCIVFSWRLGIFLLVSDEHQRKVRYLIWQTSTNQAPRPSTIPLGNYANK
jgi:hypothetical protein